MVVKNDYLNCFVPSLLCSLHNSHTHTHSHSHKINFSYFSLYQKFLHTVQKERFTHANSQWSEKREKKKVFVANLSFLFWVQIGKNISWPRSRPSLLYTGVCSCVADDFYTTALPHAHTNATKKVAAGRKMTAALVPDNISKRDQQIYSSNRTQQCPFTYIQV